MLAVLEQPAHGTVRTASVQRQYDSAGLINHGHDPLPSASEWATLLGKARAFRVLGHQRTRRGEPTGAPLMPVAT
jgi:hypothetical protein